MASYTSHFADSLIAEAEKDSRIVAIHAAMGGGTGMNKFAKRFPSRIFDVGIAEQVISPYVLPRLTWTRESFFILICF